MKFVSFSARHSLWAAGGLLGLAVLVLALVVFPPGRHEGARASRPRRSGAVGDGGPGRCGRRRCRHRRRHRDPGVRKVCCCTLRSATPERRHLHIGGSGPPHLRSAGHRLPGGDRGPGAAGRRPADYQNWELSPNTVYYLAPGMHHGSFSANEGDVFVGGLRGRRREHPRRRVLPADRDRQQHHHRRAANVTIAYLTIQKFTPPVDQTAINQTGRGRLEAAEQHRDPQRPRRRACSRRPTASCRTTASRGTGSTASSRPRRSAGTR